MVPQAKRKDDLYFQMYGLTARPPTALNKALQRAIETMHRTLYAPSAGELTPPELSLLEQTGADLSEHPERQDPMMVYATEFAAILATSISATQAAGRLKGITPVRVRQLIRDGTLYAIRIEGRWRIPVFQFEANRLVPNIGPVNAALPRSLDAVSILRWYTSPDEELETATGSVLSPLDWLRAGLDPGPVVRLAQDL